MYLFKQVKISTRMYITKRKLLYLMAYTITTFILKPHGTVIKSMALHYYLIAIWSKVHVKV